MERRAIMAAKSRLCFSQRYFALGPGYCFSRPRAIGLRGSV